VLLSTKTASDGMAAAAAAKPRAWKTVLYSIACSVWKVLFFPLMAWQIMLVLLSTKTASDGAAAAAAAKPRAWKTSSVAVWRWQGEEAVRIERAGGRYADGEINV
jgi:hypothetical protein